MSAKEIEVRKWRAMREMEMYEEKRKSAEAVRVKELIDAMEMGAADAMRYGVLEGTSVNAATPATIHDQIRWRIEHHEKMIKTLQWFGAHLGLDKPEDELLVREVIMAGLDALTKRDR